MSVRSGQSVTSVFVTSQFDTGAATNADSTPTGTLYVNGTANGATVTVTNLATGVYKAAVTLPTLAIGDVVSIVIAATVNSVAGKGKVWEDTKDVLLDASGKTTDAVQTGDAYARLGAAGAGLTALGDARLANLDAAVSTRSTFAGGAVAGVTDPVTVGTNNDKTGYALTGAYDAAKTAAQAGDVPTADAVAAAVWAFVAEGAYTAVQILRGLFAFACGESSGGGTATVRFRDAADTKDRIVATIAGGGNRTARVLDLT